ncbi:MAG: hypothetical protein WC506_04450 [Candidatus Micrarchaeia archaeon]
MSRIAPGISLARHTTIASARAIFGDRMLGPDHVDQFAWANSKAFWSLISETNLCMGISVCKKTPLGEFILNGNLEIIAESRYEQRILAVPEAALVRAGNAMGEKSILVKGDPFLVIKSGYAIKQNGTAYHVEFSKDALANLWQHIRFYEMPWLDGWHDANGGMPVGTHRPIGRERNTLYYNYFSDLGTIQRGGSHWRDVWVGLWFDGQWGVLVGDSG